MDRFNIFQFLVGLLMYCVIDGQLVMATDVNIQNEPSETELIQQEAIELPGEKRLSESRSNGLTCRFNRDCISGCCLRNITVPPATGRRCSRLATLGEPCGNAQLKGGLYSNYCPCLAGEVACEPAAEDELHHYCIQ